MDTSEKDLSRQIQDIITSLQTVERQAQRLMRTARAHRLSFGLAYNYLDDDIAQLLGRLRYMQRVSSHWEQQQARTAAYGPERAAAISQASGVQGKDAPPMAVRRSVR